MASPLWRQRCTLRTGPSRSVQWESSVTARAVSRLVSVIEGPTGPPVEVAFGEMLDEDLDAMNRIELTLTLTPVLPERSE